MKRVDRENKTPEIKQLSGKKPWRGYHIPKAIRKGKSPDEIETMRKELWEKEQGKGNDSKEI
jgi:hypothetical protein